MGPAFAVSRILLQHSYQSTISMAHETLYRRRCITPHCWTDESDWIEIGPEVIEDTTEKISTIQMRLKAGNDRTTSYVNRGRQDLEF